MLSWEEEQIKPAVQPSVASADFGRRRAGDWPERLAVRRLLEDSEADGMPFELGIAGGFYSVVHQCRLNWDTLEKAKPDAVTEQLVSPHIMGALGATTSGLYTISLGRIYQ